MAKDESNYLVSGRLSDVLALIQILALSPKTRRSNSGLMSDLQYKPKSAADWIEVGRQHSEFFRVMKPDGKDHSNVALIARNAQEYLNPDDEEDVRKPVLPTDATARLMEMALDLHTRQQQRRDAWKTIWVPIAVAIFAAIASISAAFVSANYKSHDKPAQNTVYVVAPHGNN